MVCSDHVETAGYALQQGCQALPSASRTGCCGKSNIEFDIHSQGALATRRNPGWRYPSGVKAEMSRQCSRLLCSWHVVRYGMWERPADFPFDVDGPFQAADCPHIQNAEWKYSLGIGLCRSMRLVFEVVSTFSRNITIWHLTVVSVAHVVRMLARDIPLKGERSGQSLIPVATTDLLWPAAQHPRKCPTKCYAAFVTHLKSDNSN